MSDLLAPSVKVGLVETQKVSSASPAPADSRLADSVRPNFLEMQANFMKLADTIRLKEDEAQSFQLVTDLQKNLHKLRTEYFNDASARVEAAQADIKNGVLQNKQTVTKYTGKTAKENMLKFQNDANALIQQYRDAVTKLDPRVVNLANKNASSYITNYQGAVYDDLTQEANKNLLRSLSADAALKAEAWATEKDLDPNAEVSKKKELELKESLHLSLMAQGYNMNSPEYLLGMRSAMSKAQASRVYFALENNDNIAAARKLYKYGVDNKLFTAEDDLAALSKIHNLEEKKRREAEIAATRAAAQAAAAAAKRAEYTARLARGDWSEDVKQKVSNSYFKQFKEQELEAFNAKMTLFNQGQLDQRPVMASDDEIRLRAEQASENERKACASINTSDGRIATAAMNVIDDMEKDGTMQNIHSEDELYDELTRRGANAQDVKSALKMKLGETYPRYLNKLFTGYDTRESNAATKASFEKWDTRSIQAFADKYGYEEASILSGILEIAKGELTDSDARALAKSWVGKLGSAQTVSQQNERNSIYETGTNVVVNHLVEDARAVDNLLGETAADNLSKMEKIKRLKIMVGPEAEQVVADYVNEATKGKSPQEVTNILKSYKFIQGLDVVLKEFSAKKKISARSLDD